jgi:hypothetical protein
MREVASGIQEQMRGVVDLRTRLRVRRSLIGDINLLVSSAFRHGQYALCYMPPQT